MGQACAQQAPGNAVEVQIQDFSGQAVSSAVRPLSCQLDLCRGDSVASQCNCGDKGPCCCSQCEDAFGAPFGAPRQAAHSLSRAAESNLVLRPGFDQYNSQATSSFHTVIQPPRESSEWLPQSDNAAPAHFSISDHQSPEKSARSWISGYTTAESESGSEAYFEPVVPMVITRRPSSVPPLAIPGGVAAGLKWPFDTASSDISGKSTGVSSPAGASNSQNSSLRATQSQGTGPSKPGPLKLSEPCVPAFRKVVDFNFSGRSKEVAQGHSETAEESALEREDAALDLDLEEEKTLHRIKMYLDECPNLSEEIFGLKSDETGFTTGESPPETGKDGLRIAGQQSARLGGA